jgi:hypothetical protein
VGWLNTTDWSYVEDHSPMMGSTWEPGIQFCWVSGRNFLDSLPGTHNGNQEPNLVSNLSVPAHSSKASLQSMYDMMMFVIVDVSRCDRPVLRRVNVLTIRRLSGSGCVIKKNPFSVARPYSIQCWRSILQTRGYESRPDRFVRSGSTL